MSTPQESNTPLTDLLWKRFWNRFSDNSATATAAERLWLNEEIKKLEHELTTENQRVRESLKQTMAQHALRLDDLKGRVKTLSEDLDFRLKELVAVEEERNRLRNALDNIIRQEPCLDGGGGCFYPIHDGDGNELGVQPEDPLAILGHVIGMAKDAIHISPPAYGTPTQNGPKGQGANNSEMAGGG